MATNGYDAETKDFYDCLNSLNMYALNVGFSDNPEDWSSLLQRKCRRMQKLDTVYFNLFGEHMFRTFNAMKKEDMLDWMHEINQIVYY